LERELFRQSFLLFCREEFGATTRDALLGERPGKGEAVAVHMTIKGDARDRTPNLIVAVGPERKIVWQEALPFTEKTTFERKAEVALAKWKNELAPMLKQYVVQGKPTALTPDAALPASTAKQLQSMTFVAQFAAVRQIHEAMRNGGESPQLIGGLIRGDANLGVMTECNWNAAHKAFKARALLYAHRMVERNASTESFWHLAYAQALTGLHAEALDSIRKAKEAKLAGQTPSWAGVIESCCRFDSPSLLREATNADHGALARLLYYFSVEDFADSYQTLNAAKSMLEHHPECYRIHDASGSMGDVNHRHVSTAEALKAFSTRIPKQLKALAESL
jgi:hypothetical protein